MCTYGCPKKGPVKYTDDGYNQCGYHQESGLSREGVPRPRDALECEENARSVIPRDHNGHILAMVAEDERYQAFDDADLANEGWDNGTLAEDGGVNFLDAANNPRDHGGQDALDIDVDGGDDVDVDESNADSEESGANNDESDTGDDDRELRFVADGDRVWPGQVFETWDFDTLYFDVPESQAIFHWQGKDVHTQDDYSGDDPLAEDDNTQSGSHTHPVADAWSVDADGFDMDGSVRANTPMLDCQRFVLTSPTDSFGLNRLGRDRNGLSQAEAIKALGQGIKW